MNKPKYQIGDTVWMLTREGVESFVIHGLCLNYSNEFVYYFRPDDRGDEKEAKIFPTKEELIKSL